jgi:hypothetical protein
MLMVFELEVQQLIGLFIDINLSVEAEPVEGSGKAFAVHYNDTDKFSDFFTFDAGNEAKVDYIHARK